MRTLSLPLFVSILAFLSLSMVSCTQEVKIEVATLTAALEEQQSLYKRVENMMTTISANRDGMEYPFRNVPSTDRPRSREEAMANMSQDRREEIRAGYLPLFDKLAAHQAELEPIALQLREIERDLRMLITEIENPESTQEASTAYKAVREKLDALVQPVSDHHNQVIATQDEIMAFLGSEDFLKSGVSYIIVNSPTM